VDPEEGPGELADVFKKMAGAAFPADADMWVVTDAVAGKLSKSLSEVPGSKASSSVRAMDDSNSTFERVTVTEARELFRENDLEIVSLFVYLAKGPDEFVLSSRNTVITISARVNPVFEEGTLGYRLRVDVSASSTALHVSTGLAAVAQRHLDNVLSQISDRTQVPASAQVTTPAQVLAEPPILSAVTQTPSAPVPVHRESAGDWLSRTWRDHTATFLVTTVGGLLVVAAAAFLGLNALKGF
jgi:hypothetical protein